MLAESACLCSRLRSVSRSVQARYDEAIADSGLSIAQFALLRGLRRAGPCRISELAKVTGHDRTTLTRTLAPLEQMGYVRDEAAQDKRSRIVGLTLAGAVAITGAEPGWEQAQAAAHSQLGDDLAQLYSLLERLDPQAL